MKRTFVVCCAVALLSLMVAAQAKDNKMGSGTEQAIAGLEQQWTDAAKASNPEPLAPLLADKFVNTDSQGKTIGKAETLAHTKAAKWQTNQISDVKVTVFGDTAIATGNWVGKGTDENGKPVDTHERWTDTWMKMSNGKWQCIASHGSTIKM
ncbi:MAG TPA: nuclear transport factor 2 family protein [Terriglobales bacterium]|nr:nuclear transport factor 2 family protein [Terriglobales bacterium]